MADNVECTELDLHIYWNDQGPIQTVNGKLVLVSVAKSGILNTRIESLVAEAQTKYHQTLLVSDRPVQPEPNQVSK